MFPVVSSTVVGEGRSFPPAKAMASYYEIFLICGIILMPIFYETSHKFRYFFKFFVYYFVLMMNSIILIPAMMFRAKDVRNLV